MPNETPVSESAAAASSPCGSTKQATLRLFCRGLQPTERRLLEGAVLLSQRRNPRLVLMPLERAHHAEAILIDAKDSDAMSWAAMSVWLKDKTVIWIDGRDPRPGHIAVARPVQWPLLPNMVARALADSPRTLGPADAPTARAEREDSAKGVRVLIVDDSMAVRAHLRSLLVAFGLTVMETDHANAGIVLASTHDFDCILMDVLMPGMDGYEACRRIKAMPRGSSRATPVLMLTSKASPFDRIRGTMAGCDAYLTKPVDETQLRETLARYVDVSGARPGPKSG